MTVDCLVIRETAAEDAVKVTVSTLGSGYGVEIAIPTATFTKSTIFGLSFKPVSCDIAPGIVVVREAAAVVIVGVAVFGGRNGI